MTMPFSSSAMLLLTILSTATITRTVQATQSSQCVCEVRETAFLRSYEDHTHSSTQQFDCVAAPGETAFDRVSLDITEQDNLFIESQASFRAGKWFVKFPCSSILDGQLPRESNNQVVPLSFAEIEALYNESPSRRLRGIAPATAVEQPSVERRRLSNVGKQECGIVIVNAKDRSNPMSKADAETMLYTKANNQFRSCSGNAMELIKKDNTVVITLPKRISEYNSNSVDDDINSAICAYYGYSSGCEIAKERGLDHILYSLPFGLSDDVAGSFWAKGSAGDSRRYSVYGGGSMIVDGQMFNGGFFTPSTIMHELGHNYRLGHALDPREDGFYAYGDMTTHMGGGSETRKCFNGYNYYVLGWHSDQTNEISLAKGQAKKYNLKGVSHLSSGGVVNIKVDKYFITYNLKKGINGGIDNQGKNEDYTDEVIIHEGKDIHFGQTISAAYHNTQLVGNLNNVGDQYQVAVGNGKLIVQLCSIDKSGSNGAWLSIGLDATNCSNNGPVNHPQGMRTLKTGAPATGLSGAKNEILEFVMEIPNNPSSVTCSTSGGSGDVDLIMNFLSSPQVLYSSDVNACYSRGSTTSQSCTSTKPKGQYAYVVVEGDDAFTGVTLECSYQGGSAHSPSTPQQPLAPPVDDTPSNVIVSGVPKRNIAVAVGQARFYTMPMPPNAESVSCSISGGAGDADLYTRWDNAIDLVDRSKNACAPYIPGSEETCSAQSLQPMGGVLHVGIDAFRQVTGLTLECNVVTSSNGSDSNNNINNNKPTCPNTSNKKVRFIANPKKNKKKKIKCKIISKKTKNQRFCNKQVFGSNQKVQDVCVQECAPKTNVCVKK